MMTVAPLASGQANYYLSLASDASGYYVDQKGLEPAGMWYGAGAQEFNLSGIVSADVLKRLCEGFDPESPDKRLVRNAGKDNRKHGDDLCFSAPKSVSLAWARSSAELREAIEAAMHQAVKDALDYIQDACGYARVGAQGQKIEKVPLMFALFEHGSSRAGDAQLHVHSVCPNITTHGINKNGKVRTTAIDSTHFYHHMMAGGAIFRASFAEYVRRLGFSIERDGSCFRIANFSEAFCDAASTRREEILAGILERSSKTARLKGLSEAEIIKAASGLMAEIVNLETRRAKRELSRADIFENTRELSRSLGLPDNYVERLLTHQREFTLDEKAIIKEEVFHASVATLTDRYSHWNKRDLTRIIAEESQGKGLSGRDVRELVEEKVISQEMVRIGEVVTSQKNETRKAWMERTEERFTTREILALEAKMLSSVQEMTHKPAAVDTRTALAVIDITRDQLAREGKTLTTEQAKVIEEMTTRPGGISCLVGMAGTSKSTILGSCRLAWELSGKNVIGCALAGVAADSLKTSSGIESDTLSMTLTRLRHGKLTLTEKDIVVLDEAGMVPTKLMAELVEHARKAGASLIPAGDTAQIQSIGAGGPFQSITQRITNVSKLTEIHRQREPWRKETVRQLSRGEAHEVLVAYAAHDQLHMTHTRGEAFEKVVDLWKADKGHLKEHTKEVFILAPMNCEVKAINKMCQAERLREGQLGEKAITVAGEKIHQGDRVVLTKKDRGLNVENGFFGEVTSINPESQRLRVKLDKGAREISISVPDYGDRIKLGYCSTVHTSQGSTRETVHVLLGGHMMDKHLSYVAASRSKGDTHLVCDHPSVEKDPTLKEATKALARAMSRDRTKNLATDLLEQGRQQGSPVVQRHEPEHSLSM
jgi:conjugative relaxase-like TrwC/TraI family protein